MTLIERSKFEAKAFEVADGDVSTNLTLKVMSVIREIIVVLSLAVSFQNAWSELCMLQYFLT